MIYTANITTPANTARASLQRTRITATKGLVYRVEFYFPAGSAGLMGMAVFDGLFQVWPSSVGEFFIGEDYVIGFDDLYMMDSAPYEFQVYTYNQDDTYDHFLGVRIGLVSKEAYLARFMPTRSNEYLFELIAKMAEERDELARLQRDQINDTVFEYLVTETRKEQRKQQKAERRKRREEREITKFEILPTPAEPTPIPAEPEPTPSEPPVYGISPGQPKTETRADLPDVPFVHEDEDDEDGDNDKKNGLPLRIGEEPPGPEPAPPAPAEPPEKLPEPEPPAVDLPTGQRPRKPGIEYPYFDVDEDDDDDDDNNDDDDNGSGWIGGLRGPPRRPAN